MKKFLVLAAALVASTSVIAGEGSIFGDVEHFSLVQEPDYGISTVGLGTTYEFVDGISVTGKISTPFSDYNDWNNANGSAMEQGDGILGVSAKWEFLGPAFVELDYFASMDKLDYGLASVYLGASARLTENLSLIGKIGTPVSELNDFSRANGTDFERGDVTAGVALRYRMMSY